MILACFTKFYGLSCGFHSVFSGFQMVELGFDRVYLSSTGFSWVIRGSGGFYRVFHWVLPSFTGFLVVFLGLGGST